MLTPLTAHYDAARLRAAVRGSKDANQTRRLLILAAIHGDATRTQAVAIGGVTVQIVRDWVIKLNAHGPTGLIELFRTFGAGNACTWFANLGEGWLTTGSSILDAILALVPTELSVRQILTEADQITIRSDPREASALCPLCKRRSHSIHSRYSRTLADLSWQGRAVAIVVAVRRFRCREDHCERKVFVQRIWPVMAAYARRSRRLAGIQRHIGIALGGAAGGRLACRLALPVSGDTLLRLVRRGAPVQPPSTSPAVIGIDDFAWKPGQRYGTVICDLERRRIIDLLPDRQPATVEA